MILGTCSICGGRVSTPDIWHGVNPPNPTCESCGATKANHGPVIDMKPTPHQRMFTTSGACLDIEDHVDAVRKARQ